MLRAPRTTLFVATAIALSGCGDVFVTGSGAAGSGGTSSSGGDGGTTTGGTTTGGSGGSSAGSGGGGVTCDPSDADGDGDCDDANPFVHPGALEICADGADEDCDGIDNKGSDCNAYTIYVSELGNTGATGKKNDPVASVAEGVGLAHVKRRLEQEAAGQAATDAVAASAFVPSIEVRSHLHLAPGVELVIEPGTARLSPEQLRRFMREALDALARAREEEKQE